MMNHALAFMSFVVLICCFIFFIDRQDNIHLGIQIIITVILVAYEILLLFKIYKNGNLDNSTE